MGIGWIVAFCLIGAGSGVMLPIAAEKLAVYKTDGTPGEGYRFRTPPLWIRVGMVLINLVLWGTAAVRSEYIWTAVLVSMLFSVGGLIAIIDFQIRIIPNELVLAMLVMGILFQIRRFGVGSLCTAGITMILMLLLFLAAGVVSGAGTVGGGDIKLAGVIGLTLGYPFTVTALLMMSVAMVGYSTVGLMLQRITLRSMIPLAPFMMLGLVGTIIKII